MIFIRIILIININIKLIKSIENCKTINSLSTNLCKICENEYVLSYDATSCIN